MADELNAIEQSDSVAITGQTVIGATMAATEAADGVAVSVAVQGVLSLDVTEASDMASFTSFGLTTGELAASDAPDVARFTSNTGPFFFAWVDPNTLYDPVAHSRFDEEIFSFRVEHSEGDFAQLTIEVRNPRIGLLAPARKVWAWLSWFNGVANESLFYGRLVGVPDNIYGEIVRLVFIARPHDYTVQKEALAALMRVAPYYDPIFIDEQRRADPDVVLEGRSALWHVDRLTHELTASDVVTGEDGLVEFDVDNVFADSVSTVLNQMPLRSVTVNAVIGWNQSAQGTVSLTECVVNSWPTGGFLTYQINSFSGEGLLNAWPKPEQNIGAGWRVAESTIIASGGTVVKNEHDALKVVDGVVVPKAVSPGSLIIPTLSAVVLSHAVFLESIVVPLWWYTVRLSVKYDVKRGRKELVNFVLKSNMQPIVTLPGEDETLILTMNSVDVSLPINGVDGETWIGDVRSRSFVQLPRGRQAIEYLLAVARAHLIVRSRAVEIKFETYFQDAIALTLRKNGRLTDPHLPGGAATGKIVSYAFGLDGETGSLVGSVTLGCAVGYGTPIQTSRGVGTYAQDGYMQDGYQQRIGQVVAALSGQVGYEIPAIEPNDDGLDFTQPMKWTDIVTFFQVTNGPEVQRAAMQSVKAEPFKLLDQNRVSEKLQELPTTVKIELRPFTGGPFETVFDLNVTDLVVPAQINLEAST
jgi:hypothetical protein